MSKRLLNKVAFITGGGSGIGRATSDLFAKEGCSLVIADINSQNGQETITLIQQKFPGTQAIFHLCDVTKPKQLSTGMDLAISKFGGLDIVFNNAGIGLDESKFFSENPTLIEEHLSLIDINLHSVITGTQLALIKMRERKIKGIIINTASMGGLIPMNDTPIYATTKAGVIHFTRSIALNTISFGIRVNVICPSFTDTSIITEKSREMIMNTVGKFVSSSTVAEGVLQLCLDENQNGAVMRVTLQKGIDYLMYPQPKL